MRREERVALSSVAFENWAEIRELVVLDFNYLEDESFYRASKRDLRATLIGAIITLRAIFRDFSCQNLILQQN